MTNQQPASGIPSDAYTRDYYQNCCQGYDEFKRSRGELLPVRIQLPLDYANVQPGMEIVDVGCGRGELLIHCARRGATVWGLDYAQEALELVNELLQADTHAALRPRIHAMRSSALTLPLADESMDVAFMLDVVEHLYHDELNQALCDIWRVLKPGGRLIIHTMPNLWYYGLGYPVYRALQRLRGEQLPEDPRERWDYSDVHVNEQTPRTMRGYLQANRYRSRVWLQSTQSYAYERNPLVRLGMQTLTRVYPMRWIFCNDIFAVGTKPKSR